LETAEIRGNRTAGEGYMVMDLYAPAVASSSSPGQFVNVKAREEGQTDPLLRVPLGLHAINGTSIKLLYKVVGNGTRALSRKKESERLDILGPLGNGFDLSGYETGGAGKALIVAGGRGVAPLYALAERLLEKGARVHFLYGASSKAHLVCIGEMREMRMTLETATEDGTEGHKGCVTDLVRGELGGDSEGGRPAGVFACGPRPMLAALAGIAAKAGVKLQVSLDEYVACGIGACLGCAVRTTAGYRMVCKDGPVFDASDIIW
jgi:dihydroorotate dehydrogenase electron transfer subunit